MSSAFARARRKYQIAKCGRSPFYKGFLHVLELPSVEKYPFSHTW
jgi:hypothetical protein